MYMFANLSEVSFPVHPHRRLWRANLQAKRCATHSALHVTEGDQMMWVIHTKRIRHAVSVWHVTANRPHYVWTRIDYRLRIINVLIFSNLTQTNFRFRWSFFIPVFQENCLSNSFDIRPSKHYDRAKYHRSEILVSVRATTPVSLLTSTLQQTLSMTLDSRKTHTHTPTQQQKNWRTCDKVCVWYRAESKEQLCWETERKNHSLLYPATRQSSGDSSSILLAKRISVCVYISSYQYWTMLPVLATQRIPII